MWSELTVRVSQSLHLICRLIRSVAVVINYDTPTDADSYLHRVGRAGRFGTKGLAITFVSTDDDSKVLETIQSRFEVAISDLPETIEASTYSKSRLQARLRLDSHAIFHSERLNGIALRIVLCLVVCVRKVSASAIGKQNIGCHAQ